MYKPIKHEAMKFYQNKKTGEIIGIQNMREVIDFPTKKSRELGYIDYSYKVVYDMICPNNLLGNGIVSYCITSQMLHENYKRIRKEIALEKYPEFKQYRHEDLRAEEKLTGIPGIEILHKQTF